MGDARTMPRIRDNDWVTLRRALNTLSKLSFGQEASPKFGGLNITGDISIDGSATIGIDLIVGGDAGITGDLTVGGNTATGGGRKVNSIDIDDTDSPYAILDSDHNIFCNTDAGDIVLNLPVGIADTNYRLINAGTGTVTVSPDGTEELRGVNEDKTMGKGTIVILTYSLAKGWY